MSLQGQDWNRFGIDLVQYYNGMNWKGNPYMISQITGMHVHLDQLIDQIIVLSCQLAWINN